MSSAKPTGKSKATESVNKSKLVPCRCKRIPRIVESEHGIYYIKCGCGMEFWLTGHELSDMPKRAVAEKWNRV